MKQANLYRIEEIEGRSVPSRFVKIWNPKSLDLAASDLRVRKGRKRNISKSVMFGPFGRNRTKIEIPEKKLIYVGLQSIYGIGATRAKYLIEKAGMCFSRKQPLGPKIKDVTERRRLKLIEIIDKTGWKLEEELRNKIIKNIKEKIKLQSYEGLRHSINLPVRGQRTHTNAQTQKRLKRTKILGIKPIVRTLKLKKKK